MTYIRKNWKRLALVGSTIIALVLVCITIAYSWGSTGHRIINRKAPMHLPSSMSLLKADSLFYASHASDADSRRNYSDTSFWAEHPRHYIDIDAYPNFHQLPHDLDSVIMLYGRSYVRDIGVLPWATVMVLDSLVAQLARGDTAKAKLTMSDLGHYVGDAHQPLHCTKNYDGALTGNGGIHSRYESSMINLYQSSLTNHTDSIQYIDSPIDYIFEYIYRAQSYVDSIMAADNYAKSTSGWSGSGTPPSAYYSALWERTRGFTIEQFQRATVSLASLWYTAWVDAQALTGVVDTIEASSIGQGTISPSGLIVVPYGRDTTFTFTPQIGYHVDSVHVDGIRVDSLSSYTFHNNTSYHTIVVWFGINQYTIIASSGLHGLIIPSGAVNVTHGGIQSFTITPDSGYQLDSVIVDGVKVQSDSIYSFTNVTENHSIHVTFESLLVTVPIQLAPRWNLISIPVVISDARRLVLFPNAISDAFAYKGTYSSRETLSVGEGYWLKFPSKELDTLTGSRLEVDTINVFDGWNLIGSIMTPVPVISIISNPPNIVTSSFYCYENGYVESDTVYPAKGYWVKVSQPASLILTSNTTSLASKRVRIVPTSELPPDQPEKLKEELQEIPGEFALHQNYPNPFNPSTAIRYSLPVNSYVTLKVYNMLGQEVATLVDELQEAGYKSVEWDGRNVPSGVLSYRLQAEGYTVERKMLLVK